MSADVRPYAFVIMPIGRAPLEKIWDEAIQPAIEDGGFGLKARRVDKHHEGGILGNHILDFIDGATLIIADLTHGRPNVYLEVGYAMRAHQQGSGTGTRKNPRLILMAREDHNKDSQNFRPGTPEKIHFDLEDYGILWWRDAADYRGQLNAEIVRRLKMVHHMEAAGTVALPPPPAVIDSEWVVKRQEHVNLRTRGLGDARTEFAAGVRHNGTLRKRSTELLAAAKSAPRYGFGVGSVWSRLEHAPKAMPDGGLQAYSPHGWGGVQYWAMSPDGQFFRSASLAEDGSVITDRDGGVPGKLLWIDARVRELIETLAYVARVYRELEVPGGSEVQFRFALLGMAGRRVGCADTKWWWPPEPHTTDENTYVAAGSFRLGTLADRAMDLVVSTLEPLFVLFELEAGWEPILKNMTRDTLETVALDGL